MTEILPYEQGGVVFREYDVRAPLAAGMLIQAIEERASGVVTEHIGSKAVPACRGKGILDLMRVAAVSALGGICPVHAHIVQRDGSEHRELIAFRDALRRDARLRAEYERVKARILESGVTDSLDYSKAKGAFIESALSRIS